jgi:hypothetical protein
MMTALDCPMAHRNQQTRMGEIELQTPASVWNAIRYLDSSTDYREHLPCLARCAPPQESEFVLLDNSEQGWASLHKGILITILICMILLLLLRT